MFGAANIRMICVSLYMQPNPLQQNPTLVLDLADYACQQLSVSFAVINTAGLSNFSVPQIIDINGGKWFVTIDCVSIGKINRFVDFFDMSVLL